MRLVKTLPLKVHEWTKVIKEWAQNSQPLLVQAFQQVRTKLVVMNLDKLNFNLNLNVKVRPREYSTEEVSKLMLDQDLAGIPEVLTILEEKQLVADRLDPRVRYFPTSNVDLCDNVDDRLSISSSINHLQYRFL